MQTRSATHKLCVSCLIRMDASALSGLLKCLHSNMTGKDHNVRQRQSGRCADLIETDRQEGE